MESAPSPGPSSVASGLDLVNPSLELPDMSNHQIPPSQAAANDAEALVAGDQLDRQVARVASSHGTELPRDPVELHLNKRGPEQVRSGQRLDEL